MRIIAMLCLLAFTGCASMNWHPPEEPPAKPLELIPGAERIRVGKSDAPEGSQDVGLINVHDGGGCGSDGVRGSSDAVMIKLKNQAFALGANYVQIMTIVAPHPEIGCFDNAFVITGMAYKSQK